MIQWYPGHMHKAGKALRQILPQVDVVVEVLDARLPGSSSNPLLARLRGDKPCVKLLNKADLADPARLAEWVESLERDSRIRTLVTATTNPEIERLPVLCRQLVPAREQRSAMVYALITGIPNVGKSTLINRLAGRKIAKTGNEAALTRMQQRIEVSSELTLIDTPGMLWPNIENAPSGFRLAATGAMRETAFDLAEVGAFVAADYPERLLRRYDIDALPDDEIALMETVAQRRGCLKAGGKVDFDKVARLLINELRAGELGGICLETPARFAVEQERSAVLKAARTAAREARRAARQNHKKSRRGQR